MDGNMLAWVRSACTLTSPKLSLLYCCFCSIQVEVEVAAAAAVGEVCVLYWLKIMFSFVFVRACSKKSVFL